MESAINLTTLVIVESRERGRRGTRVLWGNPNPSRTVQVWPMQHPVEAALIWSVVIIAVAAPAASHFFKQRTTD